MRRSHLSPREVMFGALVGIVYGSLLVAAVVAVRPIPDVAFVLQCSGLGALLGGATGFAMRRKSPAREIAEYAMKSSLVFAGIGILIVIGDAVMS